MRKIIYIIPGFHGSTDLVRYQRIIKVFRKRGFVVKPIVISWNYKVMTDYVDQFLGQLMHKENDEVYVFGFSFGAMIVFISAKDIKPKKIILASLSPFFKEDLPYLKKSWRKYVGKKRLIDFKNFSFDKIAQNIKCNVQLLVGQREDSLLHRRAKLALEKIPKSNLCMVNGARHNIEQQEYFKAITKVDFFDDYGRM